MLGACKLEAGIQISHAWIHFKFHVGLLQVLEHTRILKFLEDLYYQFEVSKNLLPSRCSEDSLTFPSHCSMKFAEAIMFSGWGGGSGAQILGNKSY